MSIRNLDVFRAEDPPEPMRSIWTIISDTRKRERLFVNVVFVGMIQYKTNSKSGGKDAIALLIRLMMKYTCMKTGTRREFYGRFTIGDICIIARPVI